MPRRTKSASLLRVTFLLTSADSSAASVLAELLTSADSSAASVLAEQLPLEEQQVSANVPSEWQVLIS